MKNDVQAWLTAAAWLVRIVDDWTEVQRGVPERAVEAVVLSYRDAGVFEVSISAVVLEHVDKKRISRVVEISGELVEMEVEHAIHEQLDLGLLDLLGTPRPARSIGALAFVEMMAWRGVGAVRVWHPLIEVRDLEAEESSHSDGVTVSFVVVGPHKMQHVGSVELDGELLCAAMNGDGGGQLIIDKVEKEVVRQAAVLHGGVFEPLSPLERAVTEAVAKKLAAGGCVHCRQDFPACCLEATGEADDCPVLRKRRLDDRLALAAARAEDPSFFGFRPGDRVRVQPSNGSQPWEAVVYGPVEQWLERGEVWVRAANGGSSRNVPVSILTKIGHEALPTCVDCTKTLAASEFYGRCSACLCAAAEHDAGVVEPPALGLPPWNAICPCGAPCYEGLLERRCSREGCAGQRPEPEVVVEETWALPGRGLQNLDVGNGLIAWHPRAERCFVAHRAGCPGDYVVGAAREAAVAGLRKRLGL